MLLTNRSKITCLIAITFLVVLMHGWSTQSQGNTFDFDRINRATVFILQTREFGDDVITCVGSGTIVDASGLILSNAHNTVPNSQCPGTSLIVALIPGTDQPPIARFRAEIANASPGLDIALLRITSQLDGRPIETATLSLPFVEIAENPEVRLDDTIRVFGFTDIMSNSVQNETGVINGFISEPSNRERSWIKVEANIPGTMTGGGVYNQNGRLIGIPTTATPSTDSRTCQIIEDSNRDNQVNQDDLCVPVGGFINTIRPVEFARPLLRSASLGLQVENFMENANDNVQTVGEATFSRLFFSTSVRDGMPTQVVSVIPSTSSLFLFFDYRNMTEETVYELRVAINGVISSVFSLSPVRWSGGQNGLWYIGTDEQNWPNGEYLFSLFINGSLADTTSIRTGVPTSSLPSFNNIIFGADDTFSGTSYVLPTGNVVNARFNYNGMAPDLPWSALWYFNGVEIDGARTDNLWQAVDGVNGSFVLPLVFETGLTPGRYRLELYLQSSLAATADFIVAGARIGAFPRVFTDTRFVDADTVPDALSANSISTLATASDDVYALFNWELIAPGTLWSIRLTVDGALFYEQTRPWTQSATGESYLVRVTAPMGIPDGTYTLELSINGIVLADYSMQVGIGQLPLNAFAEVGGVQLRGRLIDGQTGLGISGMTFVLISEDYSVADFVWDREQIYDLATTDLNGEFRLSRPLQFGSPYSVYIVGRGYLPITADGVLVDEETPNPLDITISLIPD